MQADPKTQKTQRKTSCGKECEKAMLQTVSAYADYYANQPDVFPEFDKGLLLQAFGPNHIFLNQVDEMAVDAVALLSIDPYALEEIRQTVFPKQKKDLRIAAVMNHLFDMRLFCNQEHRTYDERSYYKTMTYQTLSTYVDLLREKYMSRKEPSE